MSRYRPPQPKSSPYITRDGYEALRAESEAIWKFRREVTEALSAAAAEGDRSENAEYIYRKKQLREIDRRIRYLQKRLPDLKVIETVANREQVFFTAYVEVERGEGVREQYRIVGADEIDPDKNYISVDSPVARALLKCREGDEVSIQIGERLENFEVLSVSYQD